MRYILCIAFLLSTAVCAIAEVSHKDKLAILSPSADDCAVGSGPVTILWDSDFGGDITYSLTYSSDGRVFDKEIATGVSSYEYTWQPIGRAELMGWIKVKACDATGEVRAESVGPVSFVPKTAVVVSKANQKVLYFSDGTLKHVFTCSTALPQYDLKPGSYRVYSRQPRHWSREYEVWMDHSLFFFRGYALHATTMIRQLGRPASHGCIRLHPRNAATLFGEVKVGTPVIVLSKSRDCSQLTSLRKPIQPPVAKPVITAKG
ncbi:MAG: L,D-transpeptidase [Armatimonadetes bacterium]|nr:L,D-transpeptidase [Armatimonadota bacterium]